MATTNEAPRSTTARSGLPVPLWVLALTLATFATGTDDMIIAGILPTLSEDLNVSEATAGQLVTLYSFTYGIGAPVMAVLVSRLSAHRLLPALTALFALFNVLMALAPTYSVLMALRFGTALAAATLVPTAAATVARHAPPERKARYLSLITAGITLSLVAGVPVGTWISGVFGWRATMVAVALAGALATVGMLRLPRGAEPQSLTLRQRLAPLGQPAVLGATLAMLVMGSGGMMPYVYLAPLYEHLTGGGPESLSVVILVFGVSGFAGVLLGGRVADTWGAGRTIATGITAACAMVVVLAVLGTTLPSGSVTLAVLVPVVAVWAGGIWAFSPPLQSWLLSRAPGSDTAVLALLTSGMYLGFSISGSLGGAVLSTYGPQALPIASVTLLGAGGAALAAVFARTARREGHHARAAGSRTSDAGAPGNPRVAEDGTVDTADVPAR
ncbi:putative MFS family arabinose efflux permease [Haloactinospora alba]|uniref:Putative MFS family arabinose efflux permease n=1 Tax=Haloactinospora alba TaxID=405555 RepID=A0A543NKR5_9ACTN|nr:MFS transporter [Haloactinospora alba]TQN32387.1 putative MFS family arabinose efflux permease [Haloactinospora alba]